MGINLNNIPKLNCEFLVVHYWPLQHMNFEQYSEKIDKKQAFIQPICISQSHQQSYLTKKVQSQYFQKYKQLLQYSERQKQILKQDCLKKLVQFGSFQLNRQDKFEKEPKISFISKSQNQVILEINVQYGLLMKKILILNLNQTQKQISNGVAISIIRSWGGYGATYEVTYQKEQYIIKIIPTQTSQQRSGQIIKNLIQYFFLCLCSQIQVGPSLKKIYGFDLVIYKDCMQFSMEKCQQFNHSQFINNKFNQQQLKIQKDLYQNIKKLHSLNVVHRDIKPQNIMYSSQLKKYVFIDFGTTIFIEENVGFKTWTHFYGTIMYSGQEYKTLYLNRRLPNFVDLYLNDLQSIENSKHNILTNSLLPVKKTINENEYLKLQEKISSFKLLFLCSFQPQNLSRQKSHHFSLRQQSFLLKYFSELYPSEQLRYIYQNIISNQTKNLQQFKFYKTLYKKINPAIKISRKTDQYKRKVFRNLTFDLQQEFKFKGSNKKHKNKLSTLQIIQILKKAENLQDQQPYFGICLINLLSQIIQIIGFTKKKRKRQSLLQIIRLCKQFLSKICERKPFQQFPYQYFMKFSNKEYELVNLNQCVNLIGQTYNFIIEICFNLIQKVDIYQKFCYKETSQLQFFIQTLVILIKSFKESLLIGFNPQYHKQLIFAFQQVFCNQIFYKEVLQLSNFSNKLLLILWKIIKISLFDKKCSNFWRKQENKFRKLNIKKRSEADQLKVKQYLNGNHPQSLKNISYRHYNALKDNKHQYFFYLDLQRQLKFNMNEQKINIEYQIPLKGEVVDVITNQLSGIYIQDFIDYDKSIKISQQALKWSLKNKNSNFINSLGVQFIQVEIQLYHLNLARYYIVQNNLIKCKQLIINLDEIISIPQINYLVCYYQRFVLSYHFSDYQTLKKIYHLIFQIQFQVNKFDFWSELVSIYQNTLITISRRGLFFPIQYQDYFWKILQRIQQFQIYFTGLQIEKFQQSYYRSMDIFLCLLNFSDIKQNSKMFYISDKLIKLIEKGKRILKKCYYIQIEFLMTKRQKLPLFSYKQYLQTKISQIQAEKDKNLTVHQVEILSRLIVQLYDYEDLVEQYSKGKVAFKQVYFQIKKNKSHRILYIKNVFLVYHICLALKEPYLVTYFLAQVCEYLTQKPSYINFLTINSQIRTYFYGCLKCKDCSQNNQFKKAFRKFYLKQVLIQIQKNKIVNSQTYWQNPYYSTLILNILSDIQPSSTNLQSKLFLLVSKSIQFLQFYSKLEIFYRLIEVKIKYLPKDKERKKKYFKRKIQKFSFNNINFVSQTLGTKQTSNMRIKYNHQNIVFYQKLASKILKLTFFIFVQTHHLIHDQQIINIKTNSSNQQSSFSLNSFHLQALTIIRYHSAFFKFLNLVLQRLVQSLRQKRNPVD